MDTEDQRRNGSAICMVTSKIALRHCCALWAVVPCLHSAAPPTYKLGKGLSTCFSSLTSQSPAMGGAAYLVRKREVGGVLTLTEQLGIKVGAAPG
jgi:hypothetical protein